MNKTLMKAFGFEKEIEAVEHGFCPLCKNPVNIKEFKTELNKKEYEISGLCQKCQDVMFKETP